MRSLKTASTRCQNAQLSSLASQPLMHADYTWAAFNNVQESVCLSPLLKNESISVGALEEVVYLFFPFLHKDTCTHTAHQHCNWVEFKAQSSITDRVFKED